MNVLRQAWRFVGNHAVWISPALVVAGALVAVVRLPWPAFWLILAGWLVLEVGR